MRAGAFIAVAAICLVVAFPADGEAATFLRGVYDPQITGEDALLDEAVRVDADTVLIYTAWSDVATRPPADPTNPSDPAYSFDRLDTQVREAASRGLSVHLGVTRAPAFAEAPGRPDGVEPGTWKPDPDAFGEFAQAIATRYSGSFRGVFGDPLPRIGSFQAWSEPNLQLNLAPQWEDGKAFGAHHYRRLANAFHDGVKRGSPGASVVTGGMSPFGDHPTGPYASGSPRMRPLRFLREYLCLKGRKDLKASKCADPPRFDILAHNPITFNSSPWLGAFHADDAATADFKKIVATLRAAERQRVIEGRHPAWATELWWITKPPAHEHGISFRRQARYLQDALFLLWRQGAKAVFWFQLADNPAHDLTTGLLTADGKEKPSFQAFRFPFVAVRAEKQRVVVWTIAPSSGSLAIQSKRKSGWKTVKRVQVAEGKPKRTTLSERGKLKLRGLVGGETTLSDSLRGR